MEHHGIATEPDSQAPALRLTGLHKQFGRRPRSTTST
jgi:hypothetical protein